MSALRDFLVNVIGVNKTKPLNQNGTTDKTEIKDSLRGGAMEGCAQPDIQRDRVTLSGTDDAFEGRNDDDGRNRLNMQAIATDGMLPMEYW